MSYVRRVLVFLRLLGITNAAVWFGAAVFFTAAIAPAFSSPDMLRILGEPHSSGAAQLAWQRYFVLQCWCGGVALVHLIVERLYTGQLLRQWPVYLVAGLFAWGLAGAVWVQPKITHLHRVSYGHGSTAEESARAQKSYRAWKTVTRGMNAVILLGLVLHLIDVTASGPPARLIGTNKFRG